MSNPEFEIILPDIKYGHLMPEEDVYLQEGNIFAVADGISRDPSYDMDFTKKSIEELLKNYPNPSGASLAAKTFCSVFIQSIKDNKDVKTAFIEANNEIRRVNEKNVPNVDYLVNDYYGCVASGGVIKDKVLEWGVIGDCGIVVYDNQGKLKLETPNSFSVFENFVKAGKIIFKWEHQEGRKLVRSQYRNRPDQKIDGVCASYGALTGEQQAEAFMYTGELELSDGDLLVFYSDGFEATVKHPDFYNATFQGKDQFERFSMRLAQEDREKYGKERTLITKVFNKK